jgi:CDP-glucose 4,6-dehydratase
MVVQEAYRGTNVLLTGLSGFKGLWLGLWLKRLGANVLGFALPPTADMAAGWPNPQRHLDCVYDDVCGLDRVAKTVADFHPEVIFHLAAQPLVRLSYDQPVNTFAANVMGVVHVLEAARLAPSVKAVVVVTTDKCYQNREWHWGYREDDPLGGHDPYSASKACAELVTQSYRQSYAAQRPDLHIASARAGNVIGGGDWAADRLVPDIVRTIQAGQPVTIRQPQAIRPWQHVVEPLSGYLLLGAALLAQQQACAQAWNFGPVDVAPLTVGEVATQAVSAWGEGELNLATQAKGPHEARYLKLDSSKAIAELGWRPLLSNEERIGWTVDWYKACRHAPERAWEFTHRQLDDIEARVAQADRMRQRWTTHQPRTLADRHAA